MEPLQFFVWLEECEHSNNVDRLEPLLGPTYQLHCKHDPFVNDTGSGILSNTSVASSSMCLHVDSSYSEQLLPLEQ
jgi:hypothetical protein